MGGSILKWKDRKNRLNVAGSCVYFDSEDYKAPMSFYEPSLLYAFAFMTMYGQGMRAAVNARWNVAKHWMLMCKYGATGYFDRDEIGEGAAPDVLAGLGAAVGEGKIARPCRRAVIAEDIAEDGIHEGGEPGIIGLVVGAPVAMENGVGQIALPPRGVGGEPAAVGRRGVVLPLIHI